MTGSKFLLEQERSHVLVDGGLYQGERQNDRPRRVRGPAAAAVHHLDSLLPHSSDALADTTRASIDATVVVPRLGERVVVS